MTMSRRLLGRVGWPSVFFLVAGLIFAGLGWVTYAALGVEQAQRETAARAELGNNLRVALWRLDGRMLPALGVEDSRPYYHYDSADPAGAYGPAATPLLAATLPDWMRLHFQLDPITGWSSNQAPTDRGECERVKEAWSDLPLPNFRGERELVLADIKAKFPARVTCDLFGARDRAIPADSLPLAAPLFTEVNNNEAKPTHSSAPPPQPIAPHPLPIDSVLNQAPELHPEFLRVLGFEVCVRPADPFQLDLQQPSGYTQRSELEPVQQQAKNDPQKGSPRAPGVSQSNVVMRGMTQKVQESEPGFVEYLKRAQSFGKALEEAKNAYDAPQTRNSVQGNYQNQLDTKYTPGAGGKNDVFPPITLAPTGNPAVPASPGPIVPVPGAGAAAPSSGGTKELGTRDEGLTKQLEEKLQALGSLGIEAMKSSRLEQDKRESGRGDLSKKLQPSGDQAELFGWVLRSPGGARKVKDTAEYDSSASIKPPPPGIAGENRPRVELTLPPAPHAVHLGSMRPQWVTGPDGTESLMLVRAARLEFQNPQDNKTVYQGIVIDWPKLEAKLKEEVRDLFPDARLVAVRDPAGVSPDRAMTALPVQLDVGPEAVLAPAGWTPLRIGLALAWVAAIIAIGAVGLSGLTLIDLAERRIRFVSAVTHELRTPLTSLRLYLDLLVSGMITDEAKRQEYLNTLATESDRLHRLIDNVLDFAKLEKRRKNGDIKTLKVTDLLDQLRQTWTDRLAQDDKEFVVISTLPPECEVSTDSAMIQQIVGNLIDNARKYTRDAVDKRIWLWAKPGPGKSVLLEVEDRGPGVPAGERRTIFKPFRRGELAESTVGGAGLGLALAKSWTEVLGARLGYRPAEGGVGACFRLELPGK